MIVLLTECPRRVAAVSFPVLIFERKIYSHRDSFSLSLYSFPLHLFKLLDFISFLLSFWQQQGKLQASFTTGSGIIP